MACNCASLAPLWCPKALCNGTSHSLIHSFTHTNVWLLPCKALPAPLEDTQGSVFCPRTKQWTRMEWGLNCQPFSHWTTCLTSWATVATVGESKCMIHRLTGHQAECLTNSFDNSPKWIGQQKKSNLNEFWPFIYDCWYSYLQPWHDNYQYEDQTHVKIHLFAGWLVLRAAKGLFMSWHWSDLPLMCRKVTVSPSAYMFVCALAANPRWCTFTFTSRHCTQRHPSSLHLFGRH